MDTLQVNSQTLLNTAQTVASMNPIMFAQFMQFLILCFIFWWGWQEHKDRLKTKAARTEKEERFNNWVHEHDKLHEAQFGTVHSKIDDHENRIDKLEIIFQNTNERLNYIAQTISDLNGRFTMYFEITRNGEKILRDPKRD